MDRCNPNLISSDLYFSDVNTNFELKKIPAGIYSQRYSEFQYNPTLPTGRLLVREKREIDNYLKKLQIYEIDPGLGDASYLNSGLQVQVYDVYKNNSQNRYKSVIENLEGIRNKIIYRDTNPVKNYADSRPTGKEIIDVMRDCGIMSLQGHGSPYSIEVSGKHSFYEDNKTIQNWRNCRYIQPLSTSPVYEWTFENSEDGNAYDDLNNYGKPSIIYSSACSTAPFGRISIWDNCPDVYYNMSTAYLFAGDFGGVAYVGTSIDCLIYANNQEENCFGEFLNKNQNIAKSLVDSKTISVSNDCRLTRIARNLIGDPDINVWTNGAPTEQKPEVMTDFSRVYFSGELQPKGECVFYDGKGQSRCFDMPMSSIPFAIGFSECNMIREGDFMVSIFCQDKLPFFKLMASDSNLKHVAKKYFIRDEVIEDCLKQGKYAFNVGSGANLEISATRKIETSKAFQVTKGGNVHLSSMGMAELNNDSVEEGGALSVEATSVTLKEGFSVNKGGCLTIDVTTSSN